MLLQVTYLKHLAVCFPQVLSGGVGMGQNRKEKQDQVSWLPAGLCCTQEDLCGQICNADTFKNKAQDPSKVPVSAWGTWSLNYARTFSVREDGATSFSFSYSFEIAHVAKICQNRVRANSSQFLKVYIEQINTFTKRCNIMVLFRR